MAETKEQLKVRLQAAGLWDEFVEHRTKCAKEGMKPAEARAEALRRMEAAADHPPQTAAGPAIVGPSPEMELPDFSKRVPEKDAVAWVAENLTNPHVRALEAPSGSAWGLLMWVRKSQANEATFWGSTWPKLCGGGKQDKPAGGEEAAEEDLGTEKCLALVDKLLGEWTEGEA